MRVLHVTRDLPPRVNGGISVAVGAVVGAQLAAGLEVLVLSFDAWRPRGGPRAAPLPETAGVARARAPEDLPAALARARAFLPDVVHVHDAALAAMVCELTAPRVLTLHVDHEAQRRLRNADAPSRGELAQRAAMEAAAAVIVPSAATGRDGAHVVPFGVELPAERAHGDDLLYVGRFADVKGTAELFEAARRIDAPIVVAGGLPDSPRAERRWRARAPANVRFDGWLDRDALAARYRRAAVLIAPSWTETFGLAVAEAMSFGVPVVAAAAGALVERVEHERSGLLVSPRDPIALAAAVERLRADPALRAQLTRAARCRRQRWSWAAHEAATRAVYHAALARRAPRPPR
ncbi:MAG: glycosyltransferase family 4 protein [Sandaracinaceae bacterium]|nr:glycosyltransferase family 4 protein [Sandaracinaceae bacterium]